jgi:hypothetical protein
MDKWASHADQINKIRARLGDFYNKPDYIRRPCVCSDCGAFGGEMNTTCEVCHRGMVEKMKKYLFKRRIERLKRLEKLAASEFRRDLLKYMSKKEA